MTTISLLTTQKTTFDSLSQELSNLINMQDNMKRINRKFKKIGFEAVRELSLNEITRIKIKLMELHTGCPYPSFELQRNSAKIRRIRKQRLSLINIYSTI